MMASEIKTSLSRFDTLSNQSLEYRNSQKQWASSLRDEMDTIQGQMDSWGEWLAQQQNVERGGVDQGTEQLTGEIAVLAKERTTLEKEGKSLNGRIQLLQSANQYLESHWSAEHPDTCPVCDSDVADREGIEQVVSTLLSETQASIE
jgi:DNA repair exonuclease SbcCD ATPase subunit